MSRPEQMKEKMKELARAAEGAAAAKSSAHVSDTYDFQICLNIAAPPELTGDHTTRLGVDYRVFKWRSKYLPIAKHEAVEVRMDPREEFIQQTDMRAFPKLTSRSRLYILGHSAEGEEYLYPNDVDPSQASEFASRVLRPDMSVSYQALARFLASSISPVNITPSADGRRLKVSILACSAGAWTEQTKDYASNPINNSFAARLSFELEKTYHLPVDVVARLVIVADNKKDFYQPPRMLLSQALPFAGDATIIRHPDRASDKIHTAFFRDQKLFKVIYTFEHGRQMMKFGYPGAHDWIDFCFDRLNTCYACESNQRECQLYLHAIHTLATYMHKPSMLEYFRNILQDDGNRQYVVYYECIRLIFDKLKSS